jgi:hypothetical protein
MSHIVDRRTDIDRPIGPRKGRDLQPVSNEPASSPWSSACPSSWWAYPASWETDCTSWSEERTKPAPRVPESDRAPQPESVRDLRHSSSSRRHRRNRSPTHIRRRRTDYTRRRSRRHSRIRRCSHSLPSRIRHSHRSRRRTHSHHRTHSHYCSNRNCSRRKPSDRNRSDSSSNRPVPASRLRRGRPIRSVSWVSSLTRLEGNGADVKASSLSSLYRLEDWKTLAVFRDFLEITDPPI